MKRYKKPPIPGACGFSKRDITLSLKNNGILRLGIELGLACNLRCRYCYADAGKPNPDELDRDELFDVILQAKELGAKYIAIVSGGEPLLYDSLFSVIDFINEHSMKATMFTNCTLITAEISRELYKRDVFITGKLNSFNDELEDEITGVPGAGDRIKRGIDSLIGAGFLSQPFDEYSPVRMALHTLICRQNYGEIPGIFTWCRENKIIPYMQLPVYNGRMMECRDMLISDRQIESLFSALRAIDNENFGYDWVPVPPNVSWACQQRCTSCYVNSIGEVQLCNSIPAKIGNIRKQKLHEIIKSKIFLDNRKIINIKGKCANCRHLLSGDCFGGCMANSYLAAGELSGSDERCWQQ